MLIERVSGACLRAFFVALLVAMPALMLPETATDATAMIVLLSFLAGLMTFIEYFSDYPSVVEFRFTAPFNRLRFGAMFVVVLVLSVIMRAEAYPNHLGQLLTSFSSMLGRMTDFPYSPVRLAVLALPVDSPAQLIEKVRSAAAISYLISGAAVLMFLLQVHVLSWPRRTGAFNVWVNLPMFDPTKGDVLVRLGRDAWVNVMLGILLPFLIPAVIKATAGWVDPSVLMKPQALIWSMSIWACLPANMIMRGIAIGRVADMIGEKRRRAYAEAKAEGVQIF